MFEGVSVYQQNKLGRPNFSEKNWTRGSKSQCCNGTTVAGDRPSST